MTKPRLTRCAALVLVATFSIAACGDGDGGSPEATTTTNAPAVDGSTSTVADSADSADNVDEALERIEIVHVNPGAGSGEAELQLSAWPANLDHFRVSMDDGTGGVRLDILDQGANPTPFLIVSPVPGGDMEFALSWEHTDGRDSTVTYYVCSGYRLDTGC